MKNKSLLFVVVGLVVLTLVGITMVMKNRGSKISPLVDSAPVELPVNNLPLLERPFVTLTPDTSGRNLTLEVTGASGQGLLEYELIYNATDKQEGVFGRIDMEDEQPLAKTLLLGSKSAGGKVTYHEGVTGGSLTLTSDSYRLKESFNFLHFDPTDPSVSSSDVRFSVTLSKTALKKGAVIVVMKSFGLPDPTSLSGSPNVVVGPYAFLTPTPVKGAVSVSLKLPAGEHVNPTIFVYQAGTWSALKTELEGDTVSSSTTSGNVFVVTTE